jgi:hypothetical protein
MTSEKPATDLASGGLSFATDIDVANAGRLLRRVEAHHDATGWHADSNMHVYAVYDHHDVITSSALEAMNITGPDGLIRNSRYTAQCLLPPRLFEHAFREADLQPSTALHRFAANVAFGDPELMHAEGLSREARGLEVFRKAVRMPGVLGYIACCEMDYQANATPGMLLGGKDLARCAWMVDVHDRVHAVTRIRGEVASLALATELIGGLVDGLRMLMDTTMNRVPVDQAAVDERYRGHRMIHDGTLRRQAGQ